MSKPGNLWRKMHGKVTGRPTNFSWMIENALAGSGMPTTLEEMAWVRRQHVATIVTMTENRLPESWVEGIGYLHVPTPDLTAPDMDKIDSAVDFIHESIKRGDPAMVHCAAGMGRAGTILACYLIKHQGVPAKQAIQKVRAQRPGSIQSTTQEIAVQLYEKHVSG